MRIKEKSEGKFGVKEGISINDSNNSSSSNNNNSMRVIMSHA